MASSGSRGSIWVGAERREFRYRIGHADHRQRPSVVLTVKWRGRRRGEPTSHSVGGVVEPEAHVESVVYLLAGDFIIKPENLIEQDGADGHLGAPLFVHLHTGLIPIEAEGEVCGGVHGAIGE